MRIAAGLIDGDGIPVQKLGVVDGSSILTTFGTIKTLEDRPYNGDRWLLVGWEHSFRTVPFELLGWDWAIRRHWNLLIHGAHGVSKFDSFDASTEPLLTMSDGWHHEIGFSLSGILTALRLDTAYRLDEPGFRLGISMARIF